ncbi:hypothetical protein PGT21_018229 [Puccinia graminis f. sp. tritici]|uniref:Uncharacterized protein n=1 Tax=Puccinia graminis f. sp. tritici TaxID=56615 RepID=A0A5B0QFL5_PUCGR|nr:hypothetical protein PGT21_018229 [Puccinia graminis f. sp. tritici]
MSNHPTRMTPSAPSSNSPWSSSSFERGDSPGPEVMSAAGKGFRAASPPLLTIQFHSILVPSVEFNHPHSLINPMPDLSSKHNSPTKYHYLLPPPYDLDEQVLGPYNNP